MTIAVNQPAPSLLPAPLLLPSAVLCMPAAATLPPLPNFSPYRSRPAAVSTGIMPCVVELKGRLLLLLRYTAGWCSPTCAAQARASSVLPVPGAPYSSTPLGGLMPSFSKRSLCWMGSTTASTSSCTAEADRKEWQGRIGGVWE